MGLGLNFAALKNDKDESRPNGEEESKEPAGNVRRQPPSLKGVPPMNLAKLNQQPDT